MISRKRKLAYWLIAILVALGLFYAWIRYGNPSDLNSDATSGKRPTLVEPDSEFFPSIILAKPVGWKEADAPKPAAGLAVSRFAVGLEHPRTLLTLPNGDVLVAETRAPKSDDSNGGVRRLIERVFMKFVGAAGASPNRLTLLRDADKDGKAEQRFILRTVGLDSPSGMAWGAGKLYVANHNAVLAFDFKPGATALEGTPKKLMDLPAGGGHWMRNLLLSRDGKKLYAAVGSASNIGETGMALETGRATIWEIDIASGRRRPYASGLRNANGMDWNPSTGELWTVVNERDMLGPDLVPDYLTNVPVGAQYGWPWVYWKDVMDVRVKEPMPAFLTEYTRKPEYALGAHVAPLGLAFASGGQIMGENFANGAFVARHGSWNRKPLSGYDVVFIRYDANGNPLDLPKPVLTGFLSGQGNEARGRPTWLAWDQAGALLVSDDTGGVVWRVQAPGAKPSVAPKPVVADRMPPQLELKGDPARQFKADFKEDYAKIQQ